MDKSLTDWAEKIYREAEIVWKKLISFQKFPTNEDEEKFRKEMHEKKFGEFISVLQNNAGILYLKIGNYKMEFAYDPACKHIEKIKKILATREDWQAASQEIITQLAGIPAHARRIHLLTLYPEIDTLKKENEKLKGENIDMRKSYGREKALEIIIDQKKEKIKELESKLAEAEKEIMNLHNIIVEIDALPPEKQEKFIGIQPSEPWPRK